MGVIFFTPPPQRKINYLKNAVTYFDTFLKPFLKRLQISKIELVMCYRETLKFTFPMQFLHNKIRSQVLHEL